MLCASENIRLLFASLVCQHGHLFTRIRRRTHTHTLRLRGRCFCPLSPDPNGARTNKCRWKFVEPARAIFRRTHAQSHSEYMHMRQARLQLYNVFHFGQIDSIRAEWRKEGPQRWSQARKPRLIVIAGNFRLLQSLLSPRCHCSGNPSAKMHTHGTNGTYAKPSYERNPLPLTQWPFLIGLCVCVRAVHRTRFNRNRMHAICC